MNEQIKKLVEELNNELDSILNELTALEELAKKSKERESEAQTTILKQKEKLKELENKLLGCNSDKDKIKIKLDKKIKELGENKDQIIKLLTDYGINEVCQKLIQTWTDYAISQEHFIQN